jgi:hypothetical protein
METLRRVVQMETTLMTKMLLKVIFIRDVLSPVSYSSYLYLMGLLIYQKLERNLYLKHEFLDGTFD